jgi:hypothetical protein
VKLLKIRKIVFKFSELNEIIVYGTLSREKVVKYGIKFAYKDWLLVSLYFKKFVALYNANMYNKQLYLQNGFEWFLLPVLRIRDDFIPDPAEFHS